MASGEFWRFTPHVFRARHSLISSTEWPQHGGQVAVTKPSRMRLLVVKRCTSETKSCAIHPSILFDETGHSDVLIWAGNSVEL